jgi:Tol biopolymer transport system component
MSEGISFNCRSFPRMLIIAGVIVLLFVLNACSEKPTAPPTALPTAATIPLSTMTLTPTESAPLSGSGGGVIAYATLQNGSPQIYAMNADGSGQKRLTFGVQGGCQPSWSPDGAKLVFQYGGLWIADIASGEISRLPLKVGKGNLVNPYLSKPSWSPDGEWIAFLNERGILGDIYLVKPDGTGLTRLTDSDDISRDGNLVWSPDGKQIAFSANRDGKLEIYVMDVGETAQGIGNQQHQLTESSKFTRNLVTSWSPDGSRIAFSSDRDGNTEIYLMDPDGSNAVRLTDHPASDIEPDWSPDGKQIVFSSNRDGNFEIYILDVEEALQSAQSATVRRLTDCPKDGTGPVWRPLP